MPRKHNVGPHWSPSAVWLKTTSRITSRPAPCSACTMRAKLVHLAAAVVRRRVAVVRGEVADRLVAPVVAQSALDQLRVVDELVHRQQLDRGDAEALQVSERGGMREAGVGAAKLAGHAGVQLGEALDVDLVEDRVGHRPSGRRVAVPVEVRGDDDGARHIRAPSRAASARSGSPEAWP